MFNLFLTASKQVAAMPQFPEKPAKFPGRCILVGAADSDSEFKFSRRRGPAGRPRPRPLTVTLPVPFADIKLKTDLPPTKWVLIGGVGPGDLTQ